jgi:predicted MFS family arabinose efflux permease
VDVERPCPSTTYFEKIGLTRRCSELLAAVPLFFIRQLRLVMLFLGVAGASWAPYTPMGTTLLQRFVPAAIRGRVFGARHSLVAAAAPLGAAFGGVLLQYLSAPLVIATSGLACVLAGLGGLVSPSLRPLQPGRP